MRSAACLHQPDKPKNRGMKLTFSPVKEYALTQGIRGLSAYQNAGWDSPGALCETLQPELMVVAAYGTHPAGGHSGGTADCGSINVHSSILPQYRGAAPINWAILDG